MTVSERLGRLSRLELCNGAISLLLYLAQIGWLIYGNILYFNLPADMPAMYENFAEAAAETGGSELTEEEINSEKWLYVALMTVLTIGYVHLMIFAALLVIFIIYSVNRCCYPQSNGRFGQLSPSKLWMFIDEGIFSILDELDDEDILEDYREEQDREDVERRLALEKLDAKPFEAVRIDTIAQIRDGNVKGNLASFRSPSNASLSPSRQNQRAGGSSFRFPE